MTGLPTLLVELDDGTGTFPYDITEYVHLPTGYSITRGRGSEFDSIDPSTLSITLQNDEGHFTLGSPTFGTFVDQMIRVTLSEGAVTSARFTGYVQNWPTSWVSAQAALSLSTVTAVDRLARLERRQLRSMLEQEILILDPAVYYTLGEPSGSVSAGDTSGNGRPPLVASGDVEFGGGTGPGVDGLTAAQFDGTGYLSNVPGLSSTEWTLSWFMVRDGVPADPEWIVLLNGLPVSVGVAGNLFVGVLPMVSTATVTDGLTHHICLVRGASALRLYIDGVLDNSTALLPTGALASLSVGGAEGVIGLTGTLSHVAIYEAALTAGEVAEIASAAQGLAGESSDTRVERIISYAGVGLAEASLEPGVAEMSQQTTSGASVMGALNDVSTTEGGSLFVAGDGDVVFQNRTHRVLSATGTAALVLQSGDAGPDLVWSADKNYMKNYVTGNRPNGAEQAVRNQGSIDVHEQYPASVSLLVDSDDAVLHAIEWQANIYGTVQPRVTQVAIDLLTQPNDAVRAAALDVELGDRLTISGMPSQAPVATADLLIEGWTETYSKDAWALELNTVSADNFRAWVIEDPVYGALEGPFTRVYY